MLSVILIHASTALLSNTSDVRSIMTETGGRLWVQTIYYPFLHCSVNGRGKALNTVCECGKYDTKNHSNVPYIESIAVANGNDVTLFAVNRSADESCELELDGFDGYKLVSHTVLTDNDMKRCNSAYEPNAVSPVQQEISGEVSLVPRSWNMLKFTVK